MTDRNPLDDLPKRHEREVIVANAESDISIAISEFAHAHELTYAELFGILARNMGKWAQRAEHQERGQPTTDDEGDE